MRQNSGIYDAIKEIDVKLKKELVEHSENLAKVIDENKKHSDNMIEANKNLITQLQS